MTFKLTSNTQVDFFRKWIISISLGQSKDLNWGSSFDRGELRRSHDSEVVVLGRENDNVIRDV